MIKNFLKHISNKYGRKKNQTKGVMKYAVMFTLRAEILKKPPMKAECPKNIKFTAKWKEFNTLERL